MKHDLYRLKFKDFNSLTFSVIGDALAIKYEAYLSGDGIITTHYFLTEPCEDQECDVSPTGYCGDYWPYYHDAEYAANMRTKLQAFLRQRAWTYIWKCLEEAVERYDDEIAQAS